MIGALWRSQPQNYGDLARDAGVRGRVRHLPLAWTVSVLVAVLSAAVAGLVSRSGGAPIVAMIAVVAGVGLVAASYTASTLAIAWADAVNPRLVLSVGMAMYVTKFSLFGLLVLAVGASEWSGRVPMAIGVIAGVVAWVALQIAWTLRHDYPPPLAPPSSSI